MHQYSACQDPELFTHPPDEEIKRQIDKGKLVDLEKVVDNHHAVAGLILQYLHELPDPIIPVDFSDCFWGIFSTCFQCYGFMCGTKDGA